MKLTYWIADCLDDSKAYSIRAKTRKEVNANCAAWGAARFAEPRKIEIQYTDALDLARQLLGEGGAEGEPSARDWGNEGDNSTTGDE